MCNGCFYSYTLAKKFMLLLALVRALWLLTYQESVFVLHLFFSRYSLSPDNRLILFLASRRTCYKLF